ncbi:hypothetical protein AUP74_01132 [Microbulbifer aggregans]|uniref:Uncharacterized protein n=2 Tax=Microbulbifer aggregans TaxID=1769779 RepID=A0A1C9W610_9GAMM|nr:hypothetical protein AUP74_01132 [Microbulbifer aggregans]
MLKHKREENFFPLMTCSYWFTVVVSSIIYLVLGNADVLHLKSDLVSIFGVVLFFGVIFIVHLSIRNIQTYDEAEVWYSLLSKNQKIGLNVVVASFMAVSFISLLTWAVVEM